MLDFWHFELFVSAKKERDSSDTFNSYFNRAQNKVILS